MKEHKRGFTLAELLIVVAIIAVLVAIAIPVFTAQKHKSEVAVDVANVRAYYAEIQTDYITTGVQHVFTTFPPDSKNINHFDGTTNQLKGIWMLVDFDSEYGYTLRYECDKGNDVHPEHTFVFTNNDLYKQ